MLDLSPKVPYAYQGDSSNPRQAWRMCFSSSDTMLLEGIVPGCLRNHPNRKGRQLDDFYRETLESLRVGDTTEYTAQLATLRHFAPSWNFEFRTNCSWETVRKQLANGIPVPFGWLHHGPISAPSGGGHWCCAVGWEGTADGRVIVHDPAGEANIGGGGYLNNGPTAGKAIRYTADGLGRRWMLDESRRYTPGKNGWAIIATKKPK